MGYHKLPTSTGEFAGVLNHQQYLFTFEGTVTSNRNPSVFPQGGLLTSRLVQPLIWRIVSGTPSPTSQIISGNLGLTCKSAPQSLMLGLGIVVFCTVLWQKSGAGIFCMYGFRAYLTWPICVSLEFVFFFEIWPDGDVRTLQQELFAFLLNLELVRWLVARQGHLTF